MLITEVLSAKSAPPRKVSPQCGPSLPLWALDGRRLKWNDSRTAVMFDCLDTEYHSDRHACSSTQLKSLARSPRHMLQASTSSNNVTKSRRMGTAVHARVLEAQRFKQQYIVFKGSRRTGGAWRDFQDANKGKVILTQAEFDLVETVSLRALAEPILQQAGTTFTLQDLVAAGKSEQTVYWLDAETGVTCKARLDLMVGMLTIDVKTTDDAREAPFASQCDRLGYDIQAAFYIRARRAFEPAISCTPFIMLAVELLEHGDVLAHQLHQERFVDEGERIVARCMRAFARTKATGVFEGYEKRGTMLSLPIYRLYPGTLID